MTRTKASQAQATRQKLERVARSAFAERGFADVSAEELAARADVTRGALYHHYGGKEGLFERVVEVMMQELHAALLEQAEESRDPLQAIELGLAVFLKTCTERGKQKILLIDAPAVLGWTKWREMDTQYGFGLIKRALAAAIKAGLLRRTDVNVLAHVLLGAVMEAAMVIARAPHSAKVRKDAQRALTSMLAGWRAKS